MAIRDGLTALLTLMALLVVVPVILTLGCLVCLWDMCFGVTAQGEDAWEWSEYE